MKPRSIAITLGISAIVAAGTFLVLSGEPAPKSDTSQLPSPSPAAEQSASPATGQSSTTPAAAAPGSYQSYSANSVASTEGTKILFFHAPWCPQCRALEASIKAGDIPDGVTIFKVDYDSNQALRQKYGVTIQTTLVKVDDQGQLIKKYTAYEQPNLAALKQNLLP